jgi:hypothetical protein
LAQRRTSLSADKPKTIFAQPQHRVVMCPVRRRDQHIWLGRPGTCGDREVSLLASASHPPADLDDPLNADVPERHIVNQLPVFFDRVAVTVRQIHVVVDCITFAAMPLGGSKHGEQRTRAAAILEMPKALAIY